MIHALIIGRKGSRIRNKNVMSMVSRPLVAYPVLAAKNARTVDRVYVSTDCDLIRKVATEQECELIERPEYLASHEALAEDAFKHGYEEIRRRTKEEPEFIVLLFANGATITPGIIDEGIEFLRAHADFDSAVTVARYNMFSALRARKIEDGQVKPFIDPSFFPNASCNRDSQGDTYFVDCSVFILRPHCFDFSQGQVPFRWLGKRAHPLYQDFGFDVDEEWQIPAVEYWLKKHGFSDEKTPYDFSTAKGKDLR